MTSGVGSLAMPRRAAVSETRNSASSKCSDSCMFALLSMLGFALLSNNLKGFSGGGQGDRHAREVLLETEQRHVDVLGRNLHRAANTPGALRGHRSEEHTSELQSLMRISYAVLCLTKKTKTLLTNHTKQ